MDCIVHGILQARILEWVVFPFSRKSSKPRSHTLQADSLPAKPPGKPKNTEMGNLSLLRGTSRPRNRTRVCCIAGGFFTNWALLLLLLLLLLSPSVVSDSVRPHRRQLTRLPRLWDSPGKNTGVGCHFLLQCMKVKSESEVVQSCPTPSNPMDCSLPGSSVHGIFQARVLEWVAIALSELSYEGSANMQGTNSICCP